MVRGRSEEEIICNGEENELRELVQTMSLENETSVEEEKIIQK